MSGCGCGDGCGCGCGESCGCSGGGDYGGNDSAGGYSGYSSSDSYSSSSSGARSGITPLGVLLIGGPIVGAIYIAARNDPRVLPTLLGWGGAFVGILVAGWLVVRILKWATPIIGFVLGFILAAIGWVLAPIWSWLTTPVNEWHASPPQMPSVNLGQIRLPGLRWQKPLDSKAVGPVLTILGIALVVGVVGGATLLRLVLGLILFMWIRVPIDSAFAFLFSGIVGFVLASTIFLRAYFREEGYLVAS